MFPFAQEVADAGGFGLAIAKQMPTAGALLLMVWYFLKFLREESARREKTEEARSAALTTLGSNCHEFQRDLANANKSVLDKVVVSMDRNTEALGANTEMMTRVTGMIEHLEEAQGHQVPPRKKP